MSLLDDLLDSEQLRPLASAKCSVCAFVESLTHEEQTAFVAALQDPNVSKAALVRVLAKNGIKMRSNTLTRHARGECLGAAR